MATKVKKLPSGPHPLSRFCPGKRGMHASTYQSQLHGGPYDGHTYRRSTGVDETLPITAMGESGYYKKGCWKPT